MHMATKKQKTGIGAALAATAAGLAAGYSFYASADAKKHRRIAAKWAKNLKDDVVREAKASGIVDRATLLRIVDRASGAYARVSSIDGKQLAKAARELKANWQHLAREAGTKKRAVKKAASRKAPQKASVR